LTKGEVVAEMELKLKALLLVFLAVILVGCSPAEGEKQANGEQAQQAVEKKSPELGTVQLAEPVPGQKDNPLLAPKGYGDKIEAINNTLSNLIESLRLNDLGKAEACLNGLDEGGGQVTLGELQREVELLHPVEWGVENYRPAGSAGALVTISITMADGTVKQVGPFSMFDTGGQWVVHYNSFADSFHDMAGHLINSNREQ
jgi:hypothetical protein